MPHHAGPERAWPVRRFHQCFEQVAESQPEAVAILSDHGLLTYRDLEQRANALAHALIALGVTREEAVGVLTNRSGDLPLAFLSILKAGGVYVPMGADLPPLRLANIAAQAKMRHLIVLDGVEPPAALLDVMKAPTILRPEDLTPEHLARDGHRPDRPGSPSDLAVILFTSGSTGEPKGVLLQHDACINMSLGHIEAQGITAADRFLLSATPGFILGLRELCLPMLAGAAYVPASRALLDDPAAMLALMSRHRVSVAMFTPSYLRLFQGAVPDGLRCVITAGERPNAQDARAYAARLDYWNIHGATEVCGTICMRKVSPDDPDPLPSGRPMVNMAIVLLDDDGNEVPAEGIGEIHVVGVGLARGYLDRPEMTAERFVETRFGRAYRSNDLGRWNENGELVSLGRADDVVKVSGQAVALGEIETALLRQDGIGHVALIQHRGRLIAFVESDPAMARPLAAWHAVLGQTLPAYMMPSEVRMIARMPLNPSGKADRKALQALADEAASARSGTPPQGSLEQEIAAIWDECLGCGAVWREDSFFALGGTSLLAVAVSQHLQRAGYPVTARIVLAAGTLAALAERIERLAEDEAVEEAFNPDDLAVAGQQDFWLARQLGLATIGAQITRILAVQGSAPPPERWRAAWAEVLARHPALRSAFASTAAGTVQCRTIAVADLPSEAGFSLDRCDRAEEVAARIAARADQSFDLSRPPLARAGLVEAGGETLVWFTLHHAVADGLSARIVQDDLYALAQGLPLPPAADGAVQAARAERRAIASGRAGRDAAYWRDRLDAAVQGGGELFAELPTDRRRPPVPSGDGAAPLVEHLGPEIAAALTRLAQAQRVGLHALLLALLAAEAGRRTGRGSLLLGTAIETRPPGAEGSVGYFVNLLPLILPVGGPVPLAERIVAAQAVLSEAADHAASPSGEIYRDFRRLHPEARPQSRTELFDITLTANPSRRSADPAAPFALVPQTPPGWRAHPAGGLDLVFSHEPTEEGGIELMLLWNPDLFSAATARDWLAGFAGWARWLAEDISRAEAPLPPLLPSEAALLAGWEAGPVRPRPPLRAHQVFEVWADLEPERIAVAGEGGLVRFGDLERRANRIAARLIGLGVAREEPVAVLAETGPDLPAALLGIWKAGAAYLPLAAEQPPERLALMARDAGARILIAPEGLAVPPALEDAVATILRPQSDAAGDEVAPPRPSIAGSPQDIAYIIYTSGTTGTPKGVLLQHDSLINAILMSGESFGLTPNDRFALVATPGFDASLWELGIGLLLGLALVPVSRSLRDDPWALKAYYARHGVTAAFHAPSYLRISRQTPFRGMRVLLTGGEAPTLDDVACHAGQAAFWNAYGPTETCIFVSADLIPADFDRSRPLTVGRPLANTRISIRREDGTPVPPGVTGEVWLGGAGLARGYANAPDLNAQRFITGPDGRFYRTGDLGRWSDDGRLEIVGRIDFQIKLHGQRVELGEIEQALRALPAIEEAVVLVEAAANGTKALWGFVRLRPGAALPSPEEWRAELGQSLPYHMIPAAILAIEAIPLTLAGKIDGAALLALPRSRPDDSHRTPPQGEIEAAIAALWGSLLGTDIWREDNFFALGGNSLLAVTIAHRLSAELGRKVTARDLFAAPVLAEFAGRVAAADAADSGAGEDASDRATLGQIEFWTAEQAGLDTRPFTIPVLRQMVGVPPGLEAWSRAWADLVERHPLLRASFHPDDAGDLRIVIAPRLEGGITIEDAACPDLVTARSHIRQRQGVPFAMGSPPLWRLGRVGVEASGESLVWLALHHAIGDGQSVGLLLDEFAARLRGERLAPPPGLFAQSAAREDAYLAGPEAAADAAFWRARLAALPDAAFEDGRLDHPRSLAVPPGNHRFEARLEPAIVDGLKALARAHAASLHALMLTLLALEAGRRDGRTDIVLGSPASLRETEAEGGIVGCYVNMLPVPCHLPRPISFGAALRAVQAALAEGLQHGRYPFARIYQEWHGTRTGVRHPARFPLFDLVVTENPLPPVSAVPDRCRLVRLESAPYERTDASPGQDMVLTHEGAEDGGLALQWHVNAALFRRDNAERWFESLTGWARWLGEEIGRAEAPLPTLLPAEAAWLRDCEQGGAVARPPLRFDQFFEQMLDRGGVEQGRRPAILTSDSTVSYDALEQDANVIAHALAQRGVGPGAVVGVLTERSAALPAALLGLWKAGAVYLPLAADLPPERLGLIAADAGIADLIALDGLVVPLDLAAILPPPLRPEAIDPAFRVTHLHRPKPLGAADAIAYILYTSGSTGRPKGTLIGHDAYLNTILGAGEALGLGPDDRTLAMASPSFDVSLSDFGLPLAFGAALCPVPYPVLSAPSRFRAFLTEMKISVADITPTYLRLFDGADLPSLRALVTGGEAPFAADVRAYAGRLRYFNAYGPTENAITSTMGILSPDPVAVLIAGRPLPNTSVHLCDSTGHRMPPGAIGEIWLGGAGLAKGYLARPEASAAAFIDTPEGRRYRSGDLGRWNAAGELEILGRADDQVKLNGIRIEPGEIEYALGRLPAIAQAAVVLDGAAGQSQSLWGFVRLAPGHALPADAEWRAFLAESLPAYMIPAALIEIAAIPLSVSGKVDKVALARRLAVRTEGGPERERPQEGLEHEIAVLWSEVLGHGPVSRDDNFFALGGHSLLAIALAHRLETKLGHPVSARDLFADPTLAGFARRVAAQATQPPEASRHSDRASLGQRDFWVAAQAGFDTRGFILPLILRVEGEVPPPCLWQRAWAALVARHPALRTRFAEDESGVLCRIVAEDIDGRFEVSEAPDLSAALAAIRARQGEPLAMDCLPLWRAGLVTLAGSEPPLFWLALHHAVGDGVSLGVLVEDLSALLRGEALTPLADTFAVSVGREEGYLESPASREDAAYWRRALESLGDGAPDGGHPFDDWPLDFPRPPTRTGPGAHCYSLRLSPSTAAGLRELSRTNGASLHALMLTLLAREVRRRTGRSAFLLGMAASTRESAAEAETVGYGINMIPLPCRIEADAPLAPTLRAMQQTLTEALPHARYPFARMSQEARRDPSHPPHPGRFPLFDVAVTENPGTGEAVAPGPVRFAAVTLPSGPEPRYELRRNAPAQDMVLVHEAQPDGSLVLHWYVNAALYEAATARRWIESLAETARVWGEGSLDAEAAPPALLPGEAAVLARWQTGPVLSLPAPSLPERVRDWAVSQPDHPALITKAGEVGYAALEARALHLADALRRHGARRGRSVGVLTHRSAALPEIVLAIWNAGAAYLPLSADLPPERLAFIAQDAGLGLIVALDGLDLPAGLDRLPLLRPECLPAIAPVPRRAAAGPSGDDPAYIIYTSGSTGQPKGVVLTHRGLNNLGEALAAALGITAEDRVLQMASPAFDAWISDLAMAWAAGAALVPVRRDEIDDIAGMAATMARLGLSVATMPPSYLRLFGQADFPNLRVLMTVGEPPILADARHYAARLRYINGYGPTETTAAAAIGQVSPEARRLTAGRPLANTSIHLLDPDGRPVPPGAIGEVWLGGAGLAAGYLNRPDLTEAVFVERPEGRLYRSGDLGQWSGEGELVILGRADSQVKLRGQRVELGEIERRLDAHSLVRHSVALVETTEPGGQSLWAFVRLEDGAVPPNAADWQEYLSLTLPSYMLPSAVVVVPDIPLTVSGKIDRAALLAQVSDAGGADKDSPLQDEMERRIAAIWAEHLGRASIGRDDDFFDLGGDSLRAIAVVNQLRRNVQCAINDLYEHPRLADFAKRCRPRPEHLRGLLRDAAADWRAYQDTLAAYEARRAAMLAEAERAYAARTQACLSGATGARRSYDEVLLTGATGYLGIYLLRALLAEPERRVTVVVRGACDSAARTRLGGLLRHYFGAEAAAALGNDPRLTILAGDLRQGDLGLSPEARARLTKRLGAIFHCAANVKHFGPYSAFAADNVAATAKMIALAEASGADLHFISTLSVCGKAPDHGFRLFTEDDPVPESLDENYYTRSKQEAERLVVAARERLANVAIHRVGNVVFAAEGGPLQANIGENAFFRQVGAFLRLGAVPAESHVWLCHVDCVARAIVLLAEQSSSPHLTHHIENAERLTLAELMPNLSACDFGAFIDRLDQAIDDPALAAALAETMETFGLFRGLSPQSRARRLEIVSSRTQSRLSQLGFAWPSVPPEGWADVLRRAAGLFEEGAAASRDVPPGRHQ
ncbi:non-ribosomal peptide synthetase [Magnetospirillum fulvum]|uniref:non-ribosomal peptide synthetase n=1 Tax=Magnetospirillum fulvum TaxID=1082 RepID=UPI0009445B7B|nr:non-ribosomal peptide synthetase [Magnetospirillum fulvum]